MYLVLGCVLCTQVPADLKISALLLLFVLLARLVWADRLRFVPLRLLFFPTIAFAVYLMHNDVRIMEIVSPELRIGLLIVLSLLMLVVVRYSKSDSFQTTPTDLLVITIAGGGGILYQQGIVDVAIVPMMIGIVVLFYAAELVMKHMISCWNCFTIGMLAVLTLISLRLMV